MSLRTCSEKRTRIAACDISRRELDRNIQARDVRNYNRQIYLDVEEYWHGEKILKSANLSAEGEREREKRF